MTRRRVLGCSALAVGGFLPALPAGAAAMPYRAQPWPADKPTPQIDLPGLDGRAWRLSTVRGHVVALNFWASWCGPCRAEMPSLQTLQARRRGDGLVVVTVNYKEGAGEIRHFLQTVGFDLPVLLDADGDAAGAWTPRVFPTTVLVDRGGSARTVVVGGVDWMGDDAARLLDPLLSPPRSRAT